MKKRIEVDKQRVGDPSEWPLDSFLPVKASVEGEPLRDVERSVNRRLGVMLKNDVLNCRWVVYRMVLGIENFDPSREFHTYKTLEELLISWMVD